MWHLAPSTVFKISAVLFSIGIFGMLSRRNAISMLMSLELMINAAALNFVAFAVFYPVTSGTGFILAVIAIVFAAAESAIALAIFISLYRKLKSIDVDRAGELKG